MEYLTRKTLTPKSRCHVWTGTDTACDNSDIESGKTNLFPAWQSLTADQDGFNISDTPEE